MIRDDIRHAGLYEDVIPLLREAFAYVRSFDPATPAGRYPLRGDALYAIVERYETHPRETRRYEAHRRYVDLQYVVQGEETVYYAPLHRLTPATEYDAAKDAQFFAGEDRDPVVLSPGEWAVLFPQDGHKPCCAAGPANKVVKVVVKIRLDGDR